MCRSYKEEIAQIIKRLKEDSRKEEEIPLVLYSIAAEKSLKINENFEEIKAEFNKDKEAYAETKPKVDFAKTGVRQNTMLDTMCKIFEKALSRTKSILASYKKLFCYNHKEKKYLLTQNVENTRSTKFYAFATSLLDIVLPFLVETATKKSYEAEYMIAAIERIGKESPGLAEVFVNQAKVVEALNRTVEQVLAGYYRQKEGKVKARIEEAIVKLGDECACLDIGSLFGVLDKKYNDFLKIFSDYIQSEIVRRTPNK